eukprot:TRINITY_DN26115_c0_g1_i1.p1 TRINITY_DN26115_c0_g1~~TRINITY_DN26115_c0_g1_i1.p1  ORF type:complete len:299 (-),score=54.86 TRINITY_DN26115_c0_g1_i1:349-1245(-)
MAEAAHSSTAGPADVPCLRCGVLLGEAERYQASLPCASIYQGREQCPHGPFCLVCAHRKEALTLPQCECRAIIKAWSPNLPPPPPRPAKPKRAPLEELDEDGVAAPARNGRDFGVAGGSKAATAAAPGSFADRLSGMLEDPWSFTSKLTNGFGDSPKRSRDALPSERHDAVEPTHESAADRQREQNLSAAVGRFTAALDKMSTLNIMTSAPSQPAAAAVRAGSNQPASPAFRPAPISPDAAAAPAQDGGASTESPQRDALSEALLARGGRPRRRGSAKAAAAPADDSLWGSLSRLWST